MSFVLKLDRNFIRYLNWLVAAFYVTITIEWLINNLFACVSQYYTIFLLVLCLAKNLTLIFSSGDSLYTWCIYNILFLFLLIVLMVHSPSAVDFCLLSPCKT